LNKGVNQEDFINKLNSDPAMPSLIGPGKITYHLQSLQEVYYDKENSRSFSRARGKLFIWISWAITCIILFLAGFNFLSLFFNAFLKRWKEFGMKKVLGASVFVFRLTAILEVTIYIVVSWVISLLLTFILLPWFNTLVTSDLSLKYYSDTRIIFLTGFLILSIAILVILKLTKFMYKIDPISLIRNKSQFRIGLNKYMLVVQFFISIILIISSVTIIRQTNYIRNKPLGFNRNMLEVRAPLGNDMNNMHVLKNLINTIPGVVSSTLCSGNPISDNMIARYDLENDEFYTPYIYIGDQDYLSTTGLTLTAGQVPSLGNPSGKLVNEAFVRYFDMKDPIGEKIPGTNEDFISGIVKDFNIASLEQEIPPTIISIDQNLTTLISEIDLKQISNIISQVETYWHEVYPSYPFKYLLMGDELIKKHHDDIIFSKIIIASALLSILITCFGLFALSWGTMQERSREIGIRKVVGASSFDILLLLVNNYLGIILFAFITGIPLSVYLMNKWLEKFVFKVEIGVLPLVLGGLLLILIAFLAIGYHTVRASIQNPVNTLRYE
jgi:putative ABC transport system permease protein